MRKIISLLLCLVICCSVLVGCADPVIGEDLEDYLNQYKPEVRDALELDFYIIVGEGTTDPAISTVERMINSYLSEKYSTTLDMHYITADKYAQKAVADAKKNSSTRPDIIFIAGYDMFKELHSAGLLVNLNSFLNTTDFGRLRSNDVICKSLMTASITNDFIDGEEHNINYVIPNNRPVGTYDYIMVKTAVAEYLNFGPSKISEMMAIDAEATVEFLSAVDTYKDDLVASGLDISNPIVYIEDADYLARESYIANGYTCNVVSYPTVTEREAHEYSFGIVKHHKDNGSSNKYEDRYYRCMEIIYALNLDVEFRNLLQYGVLNTTYSMDENEVVTPFTSGSSVYNMNLNHTGDLFKAYYNTNGWNATIAEAGLKQNADSSVAPKAD